VSSAYFSDLLDAFTRSYYQLLGDLADLPGTPEGPGSLTGSE
jgi:hypothetical protein